ncbi:MAG: ADP-forming succinate--CoA ligase subunit beta [Candidatus Humimicrobiaceae bacterium]
MKLLEYKGKELLKDYDIPVQNGVVVSSVDEISQKIKDIKPPYVIKVQIMAGGRGKAGGIKFADNEDDAKKICSDLFGKDIRGCIVKKILIAEKAEVASEWYLSIILDRFYKTPMAIFSSSGGIDIEETAKTDSQKIIKLPINPLIGIKDYHTRYILSKTKTDSKYSAQFDHIIRNLYKLFNEYDCTLAEINPLSVTEDGRLMAIDCKTDIDDSSLFRHPDITQFREAMDEDPLVKEARGFNFLYIPVEKEGDIAVMSNGSGMLMSCIDLLFKQGMKTGAAFDLGGGATSERIAQAVRIIFKNKNINYLLVSIFGGITRCDEVAKGVKLAVESGLQGKTVILRLEGTNKPEALEIIKGIDGSVTSADNIAEGVKILSTRRSDK